MSTQNKLLKLISGTTLLAVVAIAMQPMQVDAASSKKIRVRISHARELLGGAYKKSAVRKTEAQDDVSGFVTAATQRFLPKAFKAKAPAVAKAILEESEKYGFDPIFLMAVIQNESSFNPKLKGGVGEIGLMQIKPDTAEWIAKRYKIKYSGAESLYDPEINVRIGAAFIYKLRNQFESKSRLYLSAYNIGAKKVRRLVSGKKSPKIYVMAVMKRYLAIYTAMSAKGDHKLHAQKAWLAVSNVTSAATAAAANAIQHVVSN